MQKKLLALAIAGAMAAPLAAQAQGSNVTIYGVLKPSIDVIDSGDNDGQSVNFNNSAIGFRGSEDLGNGLKAIFQIENKVKLNLQGDDDSLFGSRDSWVGLEGGFGSLTLGNHQSAYVRASRTWDPLSDSIADYNNIMGVAYSNEIGLFDLDADDSGGFSGDQFNSRLNNSVYYTSPSFSGFQLTASYSIGDDLDDDQFQSDDGDNDDETFAVAVNYTWGPLGFVVAYEDHGSVADAGIEVGDFDAWKAGVSYKFGTTTLSALYEQATFGDGVAGLGDRDAWFLGVSHVMGKITLMASYMQADETDDNPFGGSDNGASAYGVGARYSFSKRTNLTGYYAVVDNDDDGIYGMDAGYAPDAAGDKVSGFSVRVEHSF
jgi:predicted porin